jgi:carbon-monoxide dehydrogenase small subunit
MSANEFYSLRVNGKTMPVQDSWVGESLLYVLRERLGLPGTKGACEQGECGSCTVLMDGNAVCACLVMAATVINSEIVTVEGITSETLLTDVQQSFVEEGAVQCGFCTPGLIVAVHHLLEKNPQPSEFEVKEAISGNICRCTGYGRVFAAIEATIRSRNEVK